MTPPVPEDPSAPLPESNVEGSRPRNGETRTAADADGAVPPETLAEAPTTRPASVPPAPDGDPDPPPTAPTLVDDPDATASHIPPSRDAEDAVPATADDAPASDAARLASWTPPQTSSGCRDLSGAAGWPQIEGYEILGQLGRDGQGQVYHAREKRLGLEVALKIPHRQGGEWAEMFLREAQALARVNHPNVVEIKAYDVRDEVAFFTMRLVRGPNLARIIERARKHGRPHRLSGRELCRVLGLDPDKLCPELREAMRDRRPWYRFVALWMAQAADGLAAAFQQGVLHRDIKPTNLILDEDGRVVVVDFGLARSLRERPDPTARGVSGTPPYIAPERVLGDWTRTDQRADIWALGATLYELLTWQRAYPRSGMGVLQDIATKDPTPPRACVGSVPPALEQICQRMMHRDPDQRYHDYRELSVDLRTFATRNRRTGPRAAPWVAAAAVVLLSTGGFAWWRGWLPRPATRGRPVGAIAKASGLGGAVDPHEPRIEPPRRDPRPAPTPEPQPGKQPRSAPPPGQPEPAREPEPKPQRPADQPKGNPPPAGNPPAKTPPGPQPSNVAPARRVILLFAEQDLNTRDSRPAEPNPDLAGLLRDALERRLDFEINAGRVELRDAPLTDELLKREQVIELARQQGANTVGYIRLRARPIQKVTGLKYGDETVYRWRVTLACELIDVASGRTLATPASSGEATVAAVPIVGSQHDYRWRFDDSGGREQHTHNSKAYEPPGEFPGPSENDTVRELVVKVAKRLVVTIRRLGEAP